MKQALVATLALLGGGCTSGSFNNALGTPKNPVAVLADPDRGRTKDANDQSAFLIADYNVLRSAIDDGTRTLKTDRVGPDTMRPYLGAGFHLADLHCAAYFKKTDEASRRRRFGRALTNDAGTAVSTLLGLVNAGESAVTAVAAGVGLADSSWRNYDDSFLISPDLSNVRALVLAAQDNFRAEVLSEDDRLPSDYGTAQSTIQRYADFCSHLGMRSLLDQSTNKEQALLKQRTRDLVAPQASAPAGAVPGAAGAGVAGAGALPARPVEPAATATPPLAPNSGD